MRKFNANPPFIKVALTLIKKSIVEVGQERLASFDSGSGQLHGLGRLDDEFGRRGSNIAPTDSLSGQT
jgi:hypothetical protein